MHVAYETKDSALRRRAFEVPSEIMNTLPKPMSRVVREGLLVWLKAQDERRATSGPTKIGDEDEAGIVRSRDMSQLLAAIFTRTASSDVKAIEDIAVDYLVLAHHPELCENAQTSWIGLLQLAGLDPAIVAVNKQDRILKVLWETAGAPPQVCHS